MNFKIGDVLVFTGNHTGEPHFDNFKVGEHYNIRDIDIIYDSDLYMGDNRYIIFHDHKYGVIYSKAHHHFVLLDDFREEKLNNIL